MQRSRNHIVVVSVGVALLTLAAMIGLLSATPAAATIANRQPWAHEPGTCPSAMQGAVFGRAGDSCGGGGTTFDTAQVYGHALILDEASPATPCENGRTSGACYRKWYTGFDSGGARRIGLALSPDGVTWSRVLGTTGAGSVLGFGPTGRFDSANVSFPTVIRTATGYQMWYTGGNGSVFSIGTAISTDGLNWTRLNGPLTEGAVLRPSGIVGTFDQTIIAASRVMLDQASAAAPCESGRASGACYRMWYQGVAGSPFNIGYAVSPDGLNWTRVPGSGVGGSAIGQGPAGTFDSANAAVASIVKDGPLFRMWYQAQDSSGVHRIGHVVSTDGLNWVRPVPNNAVWSGADDPGTLSPDYVWAPFVLKEGLTYRMWYNTSTRENSQRVSLASLTPGSALSNAWLTADGTSYSLNFITAAAIPSGGYVLITLPSSIPFVSITPGTLSGFDATATLVADPAAITDGAAGGVSRGAILVRLPAGTAPGLKSVSFALADQLPVEATINVQTFDTREVIERASVSLLVGTPPTPTATATDLPTETPAPTFTATAVPSATATAVPSATATAVPTAGPSPTATSTSAPTDTSTPAPTDTSTAIPTSTPVQTSTPTPAAGANAQLWQQVAGPCSNLGGAIFGRVGDSCGGGGTSFDLTEIFPPQVLRDQASAARPCEGGRTSGICYRMWYVGTGAAPFFERRIGYALSPDGVNWTRIIGSQAGGAVFAASGVAGSFDFSGVSTMNIIRVGETYRMWYTGFSDPSTIAGIGLAESQNGLIWTRVPGPLAGGAVLRHSGVAGQFDASYIVAPSVILDQASPALPCEGGRTSGVCYRMWFEGVSTTPAYTFGIGHALSLDGINWMRVVTNPDGSIFRRGPSGTFDDNNVGVPSVMKDGALFRMWYEANGLSTGYTTGHVVSTNGINWERPTPNTPVLTGASDTIVAGSPDEVWAVRALKEGPDYRLYYTTSTRPNSFRFALAQMTPGVPLTLVNAELVGSTYTLRFTSGAVPNGGSVLVTLPETLTFTSISPQSISGFGAGASLSADPATLTDATSGGAARGALVVRLPGGAPAGEKTISFNLTGAMPAGATALIQVFNPREVIGYAEIALQAQTGPTSTPTAISTPGPSPTGTNTATPTAVPTATNTATPTAISTATSTPLPGSNFALAFDGNDQLRGGPVPGLNNSQTIELWVRPDATGQNAVIIATGTNNGWSLELNGGRPTWWMLNTANSWQSVQHPSTLAAGTWSHVALSYNAASGSAQLFVNGTPGAQATVGALTVGPELAVGGVSLYGFFRGQLDELRLSSGLRYTNTFSPPSAAFTVDAGTLALFSFDEGSGQTTVDRSGNNLSLTLGATAAADTDDPTWISSTAPTGGGTPAATSTPAPTATNTPPPTATSTSTATSTPGPSPTITNTATPTASSTATNTPLPTNTPAPTNTPLPVTNFALAFDGDDQLRGGAVPGLNNSQTIELWVRPDTTGQDAVLVATGTNNGWSLELNGGRPIWWMFNAANSWQSVQHPSTLAAGTWSHVALSYNTASGNAQLFVNGTPGPLTAVGALTVGPELAIGGLAPYGFFRGQLDELRLSSGLRYTDTFTPPSSAFSIDASTLAIFSLNEGNGQTTADRSGNGLSLTLGAASAVGADDPAWINSTAPTNP